MEHEFDLLRFERVFSVLFVHENQETAVFQKYVVRESVEHPLVLLNSLTRSIAPINDKYNRIRNPLLQIELNLAKGLEIVAGHVEH